MSSPSCLVIVLYIKPDVSQPERDSFLRPAKTRITELDDDDDDDEVRTSVISTVLQYLYQFRKSAAMCYRY